MKRLINKILGWFGLEKKRTSTIVFGRPYEISCIGGGGIVGVLPKPKKKLVKKKTPRKAPGVKKQTKKKKKD